jgi:hypothetical protein
VSIGSRIESNMHESLISLRAKARGYWKAFRGLALTSVEKAGQGTVDACSSLCGTAYPGPGFNVFADSIPPHHRNPLMQI